MGEKPAHCWYPIVMIVVSIRLVLNAAISFRAAPKAIHILLSQFQAVKEQKVPSYKTIARWLMRIGLYKLRLSKERADDWILIVDNSIQIGTKKCLVVLGVRQSKLKGKALKFEDAEIILIELHDNGGKDFIFEMLEKAQEIVGEVISVCADDGSDLQGGINSFCTKSGAVRVYDTIHKIGTFLRRILKDNPEWQEFTKEASEAKRKMQQTAAAHLAPPNQRTKCRFLNIEGLVSWAVGVQKALDDPTHFDKQALEQYCGWICRYKELINRLQQLDTINLHVRQYVRENGLSHNTGVVMEGLLWQVMAAYPLDVEACDYAGLLIDYFTEQCKGIKAGQVLIGSSEIIESLFGKLKSLENDQSKGGFTPLVLGLAACVGRMDQELVHEAIVQVKTKDVDMWASEQLGETLLAKRRKALQRKRLPVQNSELALVPIEEVGQMDLEVDSMREIVLTELEVELLEEVESIEEIRSVELEVEPMKEIGQKLAGICQGKAMGF